MIGYQTDINHFIVFMTPEDIEKMTREKITGKLFPLFDYRSNSKLEAIVGKNKVKDSIMELKDASGTISKIDLIMGIENYTLLKEKGNVDIQRDHNEVSVSDVSKISGWALNSYNSLQQRT